MLHQQRRENILWDSNTNSIMRSSIEPSELNDIKRTIENVKWSIDEFCAPEIEESPEVIMKKPL